MKRKSISLIASGMALVWLGFLLAGAPVDSGWLAASGFLAGGLFMVGAHDLLFEDLPRRNKR